MKNLMKCAAILAATLLAVGFASCKTNSDDDSGTNAKIINLSTVTADTVVANGYTITGTLAKAVKISIADGATVILSGASINADRKLEGQIIAGLTCEGDATIIIADGSENTIRGIIKGMNADGAGIFVPEGKTLTISGDTGVLNAYGSGGAGIGANNNTKGGNVVIPSFAVGRTQELTAVL